MFLISETPVGSQSKKPGLNANSLTTELYLNIPIHWPHQV